MSASNLERSIKLVFGHEGGYVNNPKDPGGPTKYGITIKTLKAWRKKTVTIQDVKDLTLTEAAQILKKQYWQPVRGDELPDGLDHALFDFSVNSGPAQAVKTMQRLVGVSADGIMGARTLTAIAAFDSIDLIEKYCAARLVYMQRLKTWSTFKNGWKTRVERIAKEAKALSLGKRVVCTTGAGPVGMEQANPNDVKFFSTDNGKNTVAGVGASVGAVGVAATTAADKIAPYADTPIIKYVFIGLSVVGAVATAYVAIRGILAGRKEGEFA